MSSDRERNSCLEAWRNIISQRKCPCWWLYGSAEERVVVRSWECNELKIWPKALSQYFVLKLLLLLFNPKAAHNTCHTYWWHLGLFPSPRGPTMGKKTCQRLLGSAWSHSSVVRALLMTSRVPGSSPGGSGVFFSFQAVHFPDWSFEYEVLPILSKLLFLLYSLLSKAISQTHREIFPWVGQQKRKWKSKNKNK